jgi:hypothetical protein
VSARTRSHRRRPLGRIRPGVLVHETQTHACAGQGGDSVKHKDEACMAEHAWTVTQGSSERATSDSGTGLDRHGCTKADGRQVVGERHGAGVQCVYENTKRFASLDAMVAVGVISPPDFRMRSMCLWRHAGSLSWDSSRETVGGQALGWGTRHKQSSHTPALTCARLGSRLGCGKLVVVRALWLSGVHTKKNSI